jgi:SAM-dependent methyltransferase
MCMIRAGFKRITYQIMTNYIKQQKLWQTDEPGMDYTQCYMPLILDACCGGRQFWFDKENPNVLFADQRVMEPKIVGSGKDARIRKCLPDKVMDFRNMDIADQTFKLVVFDPPHLFLGENSYMAQSYGRLDKQTWKDDISKGFSECFRVLKDEGILIFKWNECDVPLKEVLKLTPYKPLFGHPSGKAQKTHWVCFMKLPFNGI